MGRKNKNDSFQDLILQLREIIEKHPQGGRFPSFRDMCARLGVCLATYSKAVSFLYDDGTLFKDTNTGTHITPAASRRKKVGIVIEDGRNSPFLFQAKMIAGVLEGLQNASVLIQLIQGTTANDIYKNALVHGVDALIWIKPTPETLPVLKRIHECPHIPILIVEIDHPSIPFSLELQSFNTVTVDNEYSGARRAEFLCRKGYRKVIYIGKTNDFALQILKFDKALERQSASLIVKRPLDTSRRVAANLEPMILQSGADLIYAEGGTEIVPALFTVLSRIEKSRRPAVFATYCPGLEQMAKAFPDITVIGQWEEDYNAPYSGCIVRKIVGLLEKGIPLSPEHVKLPYKIHK